MTYTLSAPCLPGAVSIGKADAHWLLKHAKNHRNLMPCAWRYRGRRSYRIHTDAALNLLRNFQLVDENMGILQEKQLTPPQREMFGAALLVERFGTVERSPITPAQVVSSRFRHSNNESVWAAFQAAQENLIQYGGVQGVSTDSYGIRRNVTTRPVRNIQGNQEANERMWTFANMVAQAV